MNLLAWVNGQIVPLRDAHISVLDEGFRTGLGVFETMRAYGACVFSLDAHMQRAGRGCDALRIPTPSRELLATAIRTTVDACRQSLAEEEIDPADDLAVRLTITPGPLDPDSPFPGRSLSQPTVVVTAHPLRIDPAIYRRGIRAITVDFVRSHAGVKAVSHLTSMLARAEAREAGVDEALLTQDGLVAEGAASNVFVVESGQVRTPASDMLAGVTRASVIELAQTEGIPLTVGPVTIDELAAADEVFLTASTREVVPLVEVNGASIGAGSTTGRPGPVTAAVHAAYQRAVERAREAEDPRHA